MVIPGFSRCRSALPADVAATEHDRLDGADLLFAWEGSTEPGCGHYYRIQGPDLLIEYDNTAHLANHVHTVLRRPDNEFGGDPAGAHRSAHHPDPAGTA